MERNGVSRLNTDSFKKRFVYLLPDNIEDIDGLENILEYLSYLREIIWSTLDSAENGTLIALEERIDLFSIEEVDFLKNYMGIYEIKKNVKKISDPIYDGEIATHSRIFEKFRETSYSMEYSLMNIQPDTLDLNLVCFRAHSECIVGLMTTEEIEIFLNDFIHVEEV